MSVRANGGGGALRMTDEGEDDAVCVETWLECGGCDGFGSRVDGSSYVLPCLAAAALGA